MKQESTHDTALFHPPERAADPHALPDLEVFELTAREAAELDDDMIAEWTRKHEYRLAPMNSAVRERMFADMIASE